MKTKIIKKYFLILILSYTCLFAEKDILVLHSYNQGLEWTDDISKGILDSFEKNKLKVNIYFDYLDAKRNTNIEFLEKSYSYFLTKYKSRKFDLIIVSDNKALLFIDRYKSKLFPNNPIVFCGINDYTPSLHPNIKNITGVKESVSHKKTISLGNELFPKRKKLLIILDHTLTGRKLANEVEKVEKNFNNKLEFVYLFDLDEEKLNSYIQNNKNELIAYILTYNIDKKGKYYSYKESIKLWKEILGESIPIIGSWSFFAEKGIIAGAITSGYKQGLIAANLAKDILDGKTIENLPIVNSLDSIEYVVNYKEFTKFGIKKDNFSKDIRIINPPISFWENYRQAIFYIGITSSILLLIVIFYTYYKVKRNRLLEKEVQNRTEKLNDYIKASSDFIWEINEKGVYTFISDNVKDYLGYESSELIGKTPLDLMPKDEVDKIYPFYLEKIENKLPIKDLRKWNLHKNGEKILFLTNAIPIFTNKKFIGYRGTDYDITPLFESEEKNKVLLESASDGIHILDDNGNLLQCNTTFLDSLGYTEEEALKLNVSDWDTTIPKSEHLRVIRLLSKDSKIFETKHKRKDGTLFEVQINAKVIMFNGEKILYASQRDISEIKQKELMMYESHKLASMGEMIGNIAHQWRQPLSAISTVATGSKLQKEMDCLDDTQFFLAMDTINNSAQYLSRTIDDFRDFYKPNNNKKIEFEISDVIDKTLTLVKAQFTAKDIEIIQSVENNKLFTLENELIQVLINILNNARDALILKENQKRFIFINTYKDDSSFVIEIKDNANGIPEDIIDRIFEPYFTTKHQSQGTGIGLYMSEEIVKNHLGGSLTVQNETYVYDEVEYSGAKFSIKISS